MSRFAVLVPCVFALLHYISVSLWDAWQWWLTGSYQQWITLYEPLCARVNTWPNSLAPLNFTWHPLSTLVNPTPPTPPSAMTIYCSTSFKKYCWNAQAAFPFPACLKYCREQAYELICMFYELQKIGLEKAFISLENGTHWFSWWLLSTAWNVSPCSLCRHIPRHYCLWTVNNWCILLQLGGGFICFVNSGFIKLMSKQRNHARYHTVMWQRN